jgi:alcohol dehydrogenase (NADP+)/uncharacterized zinc-type alcohol dehydrogenase-like protein
MKTVMQKDNVNLNRRKFIQQTTLAGTGLMLINPLQIFLQTSNFKNIENMSNNIKSRGYAGKSEEAIKWVLQVSADWDTLP